MSFEREVSLFFPAKQFTTDAEQHLRNLVALERWAESGRDFLPLINKDALPDETDFGLGTLLVENEILQIRKSTGWKAIVDEDSIVGLLPGNIAYTDAQNIFTERQTMQGAVGLTNSIRIKNTTATPPADTLIGSFDFLGKDDAGNDAGYAGVEGYVADDTEASEDGYGVLRAQIAAAYQEIVRWGGMGPSSERGLRLWGDLDLYRGGSATAALRAGGSPIELHLQTSAAPVDGMTVAQIEFAGRDSTLALPTLSYARIAAKALDVTDPTQVGQLSIGLQRNDALWLDIFRFRPNFLSAGATSGMSINGVAIVDYGSHVGFILQGSADTTPRLRIEPGVGSLHWGDGTGAADVDLYRHAANFLRTSDGFMADGGLYVWRTGQALEFKRLADTQARFKVDDSGLHEWGPGGVTAVDTNLYRSAANRLKTDDQLHVVDGIVTKTKAGVLADGDFTAGALDGLLGIDTTAGALMFRSGGAWHTLTPASAADPYTEITKGADQDVTNNAVRQNDTALTFAVANGDLIHLLAFIIFSGNNATGDYKWAFTMPANCVAQGSLQHWTTADAYQQQDAATAVGGGALWPSVEVSSGTDAAFTTRLIVVDLTILCKAAGNIVFTFANAAAAAGRTSRTHAGSTVRYRKLN